MAVYFEKVVKNFGRYNTHKVIIMKNILFRQTLGAFLSTALLLFCGAAFAENIDPEDDGFQYAWGENVGWLSLEPGGDGGPGVEVSDFELTGYMWGENIGWISLSCTNTGSCGDVGYGVTNDGDGNLSGYAWGENIGWINFSPSEGGVTIDPNTGVFSGQAWGENIGWTTFRSSAPVAYGVTTSWRGVSDADGDGIADLIDTSDQYSNDFRDAVDAYGTITNRGNQVLTVTDEMDPAGVRITADPAGGPLPATVSVCGGMATLSFDAGDEVVVTCSSVEIIVITGTVETTFVAADGTPATTSLDQGNSLIFDPTTFTITAPSTNPDPVIVLIQGVEVFLEAGKSKKIIEIDIKPGSYPNSINLKSKGVIPVAVLTNDYFDASTVNPDTVLFADAVPVRWTMEDVDRDGDDDMLLHFITRDLSLNENSTEATLTGDTTDDFDIMGTGTVNIVPKGKGK